jgi:putative membrane protein
MANEVRASDHLANERTYLAYIRTALSFIAFGFVVARFALFSREISLVAHITGPNAGASKLLGVAMVLAGVAVGITGGVRYAATNCALRKGGSSALSPRPIFSIFEVADLAGIEQKESNDASAAGSSCVAGRFQPRMA